MKFNKKQVGLLFLLLVIGGFLIWWRLNYPKEQVEISEIEEESKVQKGIDFLLTTNEEFTGGTTFLVKKLNEVCKDERLGELWKKKIEKDIGDQRFLSRLYDSAYQYQEISNLENILYLNTRLITKAAYCEDFPYENILKDVNQIEKDDAYNSTHLLFALAMMKKRGCYDKEALNPLINELVNDLLIVQDKEGELENLPYLFNPYYIDVYAERAAIIGYTGYPIKEVWIENILRCQLTNGSWFDSPHTTSLALWAIVQKKESCE